MRNYILCSEYLFLLTSDSSIKRQASSSKTLRHFRKWNGFFFVFHCIAILPCIIRCWFFSVLIDVLMIWSGNKKWIHRKTNKAILAGQHKDNILSLQMLTGIIWRIIPDGLHYRSHALSSNYLFTSHQCPRILNERGNYSIVFPAFIFQNNTHSIWRESVLIIKASTVCEQRARFTDKVATILQTTISNSFTCMKTTLIWFHFYWNLFPGDPINNKQLYELMMA